MQKFPPIRAFLQPISRPHALTLPEGQSKRDSECKRAVLAPSSRLGQLKEHLVDALLREYLPILILLAIAAGLGIVLILAAAVLAVRNPDPEKVSAYECGFNAFDDARMKFDVRFYLVSILFIIFDLEIAFLFPWAVAFGEMSMTAFWSMMLFLAVLTVGFAYEWKKGALEWE
jgi:NADH-quinone oxidoreductase subunit A